MGNIFRMNLFRLKKTRLAYAMLAVALGLSLLFFGLNWLMDSISGSFSDLVNMPADMEPDPTNVWDIVRTTLGYGGVPMAAVMGCLLFFMTEISSGYVKNLVGYEADKRRLAGANLATIAVYSALLWAAGTLFLLLMSVIGYKRAEFGGFGKFLVWWLISYVEMTAFVMLLQLLSDAAGKGVLFMILGGVYTIVASSFYMLINLGIQFIRIKLSSEPLSLFDVDAFAIEKYTLLGGLVSFKLTDGWNQLILHGVIAVVVLCGVYVLDVLALRKREIR